MVLNVVGSNPTSHPKVLGNQLIIEDLLFTREEAYKRRQDVYPTAFLFGRKPTAYAASVVVTRLSEIPAATDCLSFTSGRKMIL